MSAAPALKEMSCPRGISPSPTKGPQAQGAGLLAGPQGILEGRQRGVEKEIQLSEPWESILSPDAQNCRPGKKLRQHLLSFKKRCRGPER